MGFLIKSLAMTYFHMATCHTIIGAKRFHFRVRDGIGWFTLAMFTKQTGLAGFSQPSCAGFRIVFSGLCRFLLFMEICIEFVVLFYSAIVSDLTQTHWVLYGQASRAISTR
jgi:hypothetical protein